MNCEAEYTRFIEAMRAIEGWVKTLPRYLRELHHIKPVEHFPWLKEVEANKIWLQLPHHREGQEFCNEIYGGGQAIAVELMWRQPRYFFPGSSIEVEAYRHICKQAYEARLKNKKTLFYDRSLYCNFKKNHRRPGTAGFEFINIVMKEKGIKYQELIFFKPPTWTKERFDMSKAVHWDVAMEAVRFEEYDQSIKDKAEAWVDEHYERTKRLATAGRAGFPGGSWRIHREKLLEKYA